MARTITYNDKMSLQRIFRYSNNSGTFSSNLNTTPAFNYFSNGVVGDILYFALDAPYIKFGDLSFNIGAALAAASITIAWEYSTGTSTWAPLAVTDDTNNFQNTGLRKVRFTPPANWAIGSVNGITQATWIRARITAVSGLTVIPTNVTTVVQCDSLAITISDPGTTVARFASVLYDASVAGGWGVVENVGNTYKFNCHIFIGYSTDADVTNLSDYSRNIEFTGIIWARKATPYITLGQLVSNTDRTSYNGCTLTKIAAGSLSLFYSNTYAVRIIAYSSLLNCNPRQLVKSYNSIINGSSFHGKYDATNGPIIFNTQYQIGRPDFTTNSLAPNTQIDGVVTSGASYALRFDFSDFIKGLVNLGCTYLGDCSLGQSQNTVLINPVSNVWDIRWGAGASYGNVISVKFEASFVVKDSAGAVIQDVNLSGINTDGNPALYVQNGRITGGVGATMTVDTNNYSIGDYVSVGSEIVKITGGTYPTYNVDRAQLGTASLVHISRQVLKNYLADVTDVDGESQVYLIEGFMLNWGSGSAPGTTINTSKNPITFTFRKYGYIPLTVVMTVTAPILSTGIVLQSDPYVVATEATAGAYTGIIIVGDTSITMTESHTLQELYDYCRWWSAQPANLVFVPPMETADGANFTSTYDLIIDGCALSGNGNDNLGSNDLSIINGGTSSVNIIYSAGVQTNINVTGLIAGSRLRINNTTDNVELYNDVIAGTSISIPVLWTVNKDLDIRVTNVIGTTAYLPYQVSGTLTATGASFNISQLSDTVYNSNGVDGSTVTEFSTDYPNIQIDISSGTSVTIQKLYAWYQYATHSAQGIVYYLGGILAQDAANYAIQVPVVDLFLDNTSGHNIILTGGYVSRSDGTSYIYSLTANSIIPVYDRAYVANSFEIQTILQSIRAYILTNTITNKEMKEFNITQNEYGSSWVFTLTDSDGAAIDLTGSTIQIKAQNEDASIVKFTANVAITDAVNGKCAYTISQGDFDSSGDYYLELVVTYPGVKVLKFSDMFVSVAQQLPR